MRRNLRLAGAAAFLAFGLGHGSASAQREIVQALPPEGSARLNDALTRLARNSQDVSALVDAGEAAISLGDIDAAIGFFGRAKELSPGYSRVTLGLATAYARSRRPVEALRLFAEAEKAGVAQETMARDRALAFDLVGDNRSAQSLYKLVLARGADDESRRRLALSYAISGDRRPFEDTLRPLLEKEDLAAFRTRAFGLAILGDAKEALAIANAMLPPAMASKMGAYLEFMPRLTGAQQAAAGTLGIFPRAASVGIDDAQIAAYSSAPASAPPPAGVANPPATPVRTARAELPPVQPAPRMGEAGRTTDRSPNASARVPAPVASTVALQPAAVSPPAEQARPAPPPPPPPPPASSAPVPTIGIELPAREQPPVVQARQGPPVEFLTREEQAAASPPPATAAVQQSAPPSQPVLRPPPPPAPVPVAQPAQPPVVLVAAKPAVPPSRETSAEPTIEEAFAAFTESPAGEATRSPGAVDITRIQIRREKPAPPPAPPPPPKPPAPPPHPARHWVQVATGKDVKALAFDWRRIAKKADGKLEGKGPFTSRWVEANRLLAGPFRNAGAARDFMNELKKMGVDSFTFASAEGEKVDPLR